MRVRSWPGIWVVLVGALLLVAPAFGDDPHRPPAELPSPGDSKFSYDAPFPGAPYSNLPSSPGASCSDLTPSCNTSGSNLPAYSGTSCYGPPSYTNTCCDVSPSCGTSYWDVPPCNSSPCCDMTSCCDCCGPLWTIEAGAIFLRRDNQTNVPLTNGATPISVADLAFREYQAGPLVTLMRHDFLGTATTLEVTYFGIQDSNTASSAGATTFFTTPAINFGARTVTSDYRSRLDSTEINLRDAWTDGLTLLAGFRWIELGDELAADLGGGSTYNVNVNNHLYGAQIGADVLIWRGDRFSIDWFGKAGIYGNAADQTTTVTGVGNAIPRFSARNSQAAFLGEMDLTLRYEITEHLSVLGGYRAIWLDGIALAPNQVATSNVATGAATLDNHSSPLYHGFTAAAQLVW